MKDFNEFLGNFLRVFRKFSRKPYARGRKRGKFPETLGPAKPIPLLSPLCPGPDAFYAFSFSSPFLMPHSAFPSGAFWISFLGYSLGIVPPAVPVLPGRAFAQGAHAFLRPGLSAIPAAGFRCACALKAGENPRTSAVPPVAALRCAWAAFWRFLPLRLPVGQTAEEEKETRKERKPAVRGSSLS